jgi:diguanylate cyclase (GGDEF)-like protein
MGHALEMAWAIFGLVHARCLAMSVTVPSLKRDAALASGMAADAVTRAIPLRRFWWAAIFLLGISGSAVGWTIWELRTDSINAAVSESGNIATILAGQLSRSIQAIDSVLLKVKRSTKGQDIDTPLGIHAPFENQAFFESLLEYRTRLPQTFNIAIADKDGQVVVSTAGWPTPDIKVADRDYFKDARARTDDQLTTSIQVQNRVNGMRTIVFARRLESSSGNFAGIVFASVNTRYFEEIYGSIQSVQNRLFTLLKSDGTILVRYPHGQDFAGKKLSAQANRLDSLARDGGGFRVLAQTDGKPRFVTVRAMPEYPLFINISVTEDTALATWRQRASAIGLGSAILLACSIYFLLAATRQVRYLSKSEASLTQKSHQLARMARYDVLTGLANRMLFMERVDEALARMRDHQEEFAVLLLDLDRFKTVNDSLGHVVGDSLLQVVAQRLQQTTRDVDCVVRFGGDEFAVLHKVGPHHKDSALLLASRILAAITEPYDLEGREVTIGTSIGITSGPRDGTDADALIKNADLALYKAKSEGGNRYCLFEAAMAAEVLERRELEDDMHKAIARSEFELHYQTILDVDSQECCGAEALVRWRHPERGLIPPDQFIGLAEESGLIVPLGEWVLRQACADAAKWPPHLTVAVNISPAQFKRGDLLDILTSALANSGLPAKRLELEITETVFLEHDERTLALLRAIKSVGVSVVLDDFGIGYSSMKYLQMFPIDKIKIDKSFIQSMPDHVDCAAIVCAIAGLGRNLDIGTTAEGVETMEQFELLRSAGCQSAQGYLLSRPVPASELVFERPGTLRQGTKAA